MPSYPGGMPVPFASNRLYEPNTTIAEMILRAGQQRAQMQQQGAEGIANTISQLGQIPGQIQQQKLLQARTQREEQLAKTQAAALKRQEEDRAALDAAFESGDGAAIEARLPGHLRPQFREAWDKQQEQKAKYEKAQTEAVTAQSEMLATGARYLKQNHSTDPDGGISAASLWVKSLPKNLQAAAGPYLQQVQQDPSALPKILDDFISRAPSEQARLAREANEEKILKPGDVLLKGGKQIASGGVMPISPEQQQQNEIARAKLAEETRHNRASESKSGEPKLYQVDTVDADGNPIKTFVSEAEARKMAAGGPGIKKPPSAMVQNRQVAAGSSIQAGEALLSKLKDPKVVAEIGPLIGRYNSLSAAAGAGNPTAQEMVGAIKSFSALQPQIHGFRAFQMGQDIEHLLSTKQTPEALAAALRGILTASYIVSGREPGGDKPLKVLSFEKDPNQK